MAHVFNGIIDKENPGVCVQVKPEVAKRKVRGMKVGDKLGRVYSVVDFYKDTKTSKCSYEKESAGYMRN